MREARFKVRYNGRVGTWESIPFVGVMVDGYELADEIADGMADVPGVHEVRYNWAGSMQGFYTRGSK